MKKERNKKLVYVSQEIVDAIMKASLRRGETISKFVEEALIQAIKVDNAGYDIKELGAFFEIMRASKVLGAVFFPLEVTSFLMRNLSDRDKKHLHQKWFASGKWYGKYLKEKFEDPVSAFKIFLEASRWDLNEVEVKADSSSTKLICVSLMLDLEETGMLAAFLEGAIHGMGFDVKNKDVIKGLVVLTF